MMSAILSRSLNLNDAVQEECNLVPQVRGGPVGIVGYMNPGLCIGLNDPATSLGVVREKNIKTASTTTIPYRTLAADL